MTTPNEGEAPLRGMLPKRLATVPKRAMPEPLVDEPLTATDPAVVLADVPPTLTTVVDISDQAVEPQLTAAAREPVVPAVAGDTPAGADAPAEAVDDAQDELEALRELLRQYADIGNAGVNVDLPRSLWDTARRYADDKGYPYRAVVVAALTEFLRARDVEISEGYAGKRRLL